MRQVDQLRQHFDCGGRPMVAIGQRFHSLTVIGRKRRKGRLDWLVRCDCGKVKAVQQPQLVGAARPTKSCGCQRIRLLREARTDHGASVKNGSPLYLTFIAWQSMLWRCYNKNRRDYKDYGGRGILVCKRWRDSFKSFLQDMGERPPNLTLGRKNNDKGYSPDNCEWQSNSEQSRNKRTSHFLLLDGQKKTIAEWSEITGISKDALTMRVNKLGWTEKEALTIPPRKQKNSICKWGYKAAKLLLIREAA